MKENLDTRLSKSDPAKKRKAPVLKASLIAKSIASENNLSLRERFELLGQNARRAILGFGVSGSAAAIAITLVLTSAPQPLIQLSGLQGARNNESAAAQMDQGAEKMWMPYQSFEFVAGPNLSSETGSGEVYKLSRQSTPEQVLNTVAELFGVEGSIKKYPDFSETNPGYFFGSSDDPWGYDGKNPVISLWWLGTASWNYSNPNAFPESDCLETDESGNCSSWREFEPTPELLPSREEATAKAVEVFNATGLNVQASDIRVDISEWGVNAYASLTVDGQPTNVEWYLGWSSTGEISYAGGHSVAAESMGSYDTISAVAAVERLADWRWSGSPSGLFYERFQPRYATEPAPLPAEDSVEGEEGSSESGSSDSQSPDEPVDSGTSVDPMPDQQPETLTLTILESERALLSVWDANGEVWLVPGFILINDQGWFGAVIALIEGVIELPKETEVDIMPLPADDSGVSNK
jgi:hypothetical protein